MRILDLNLASRLSPEDSSGTTSSTSSSGDSVRARSPAERSPIERSQSQRIQLERSQLQRSQLQRSQLESNPLERFLISRPQAMNTLTRSQQQPYVQQQQQPIVRTPTRSQQVLCATVLTFFLGIQENPQHINSLTFNF